MQHSPTPYGFTIVELLVSISLLGIFIAIASGGFAGILGTISSTRGIATEQEAILYDNFALDSTFRGVSAIYPIETGSGGDVSTGYIYSLDPATNPLPYGYVNFSGSSASGYTLGIKKFIPYNAIVDTGTGRIYSAPGDDDIRDLETNASILSATGVLDHPTGLYLTGGEIYVSDTGNGCVRKLSNLTACFAGRAGETGFDASHLASPMGITGTGSDIYVSDTYNNTIRHFTVDSGVLDTVFGDGTRGSRIGSGVTGTGIELSSPTGVAVYGDLLLVADTGNRRVVALNLTTHTGSVLIGNGSSGALFVGDIPGASNGITSVPLDTPTGLVVSGTNLYISEGHAGLIKRVDLTTSTVSDVAGSLGNLAYFGSFEETPSPTSYVVSGGTNTLVDSGTFAPYDGRESLRLVTDGSSSGATFTYTIAPASGITLAPDQYLDVTIHASAPSGPYAVQYGPTLGGVFLDGDTISGTITSS